MSFPSWLSSFSKKPQIEKISFLTRVNMWLVINDHIFQQYLCRNHVLTVKPCSQTSHKRQGLTSAHLLDLNAKISLNYASKQLSDPITQRTCCWQISISTRLTWRRGTEQLVPSPMTTSQTTMNNQGGHFPFTLRCYNGHFQWSGSNIGNQAHLVLRQHNEKSAEGQRLKQYCLASCVCKLLSTCQGDIQYLIWLIKRDCYRPYMSGWAVLNGKTGTHFLQFKYSCVDTRSTMWSLWPLKSVPPPGSK